MHRLWLSLLALVSAASVGLASEQPPVAAGIYESTSASPDGIGKRYFGREIAKVMGHEGASWLERPERLAEERPDLLMDRLPLQTGQTVADLGAGSGYFTRWLAQKIGPDGLVYAVDVQPEMIELLRKKMADFKLENVRPILGGESDARLPSASIDLVLMVDVYHEFSNPHEMLQSIHRALKPGGRVAFVEYRGEDPKVPIKPLHKMTEAQVRREAESHGLVWEKTVSSLPWQHLILFLKPETAAPSSTPTRPQ